MTDIMRWQWLIVGLAVLIAILLAYAWVDGGREAVRPISQPVALPPLPAQAAR